MGKPIEIIDSIGEKRILAPLPHLRLTARVPIFGDEGTGTPPLVKKADLKETDLSGDFPAVKDQNAIGACNAFDTIEMVEFARAIAGLPYVSLSCGYLYGSINGQRDEGSGLQEALDWMVQHGTVKSSTIGDLVWQKQKWPKDQVALVTESADYKLLEYFHCPTTEHAFSAAYHGFAVSIGMVWGSNDMSLDPNGCVRVSPGREEGGHAIARSGIRFFNGEPFLWGPNSWTTRWGVKGYFGIPWGRLKNEERNNFGWWACRSVTYAGGGGLPTPKG